MRHSGIPDDKPFWIRGDYPLLSGLLIAFWNIYLMAVCNTFEGEIDGACLSIPISGSPTHLGVSSCVAADSLSAGPCTRTPGPCLPPSAIVGGWISYPLMLPILGLFSKAKALLREIMRYFVAGSASKVSQKW